MVFIKLQYIWDIKDSNQKISQNKYLLNIYNLLKTGLKQEHKMHVYKKSKRLLIQNVFLAIY